MINDVGLRLEESLRISTISGLYLRHDLGREKFSPSFLKIYAIVLGNIRHVPDATRSDRGG